MPKYYAYHGAPPIDMPSIGGTISESWEGSMQNAMAKKQKDRDLELQLRMAGAVPEEDYIKNPLYQAPEVKKNTKVLLIGRKNWYIPPSEKETLELNKLREESKPLSEQLAGIRNTIGGNPEDMTGIKVTHGGVSVDLGAESPTKKYARESAEQLAKEERERKSKLSDPTALMSFRKEFADQPIVKDFDILTGQYKNMKSAVAHSMKQGGKDSKMAADQAIIMTFNKILDPRGTVREGEYARTSQGQSLINRIEGYAQKLGQGGAGLTDVDRKDILRVTAELVKGTQATYKAERDYYVNMAIEMGMNPEYIVGRDRSLSDQDFIFDGQNNGSIIGTIEDGYEYLGGDKADPRSWRKL